MAHKSILRINIFLINKINYYTINENLSFPNDLNFFIPFLTERFQGVTETKGNL